jgi:hypothetical protein
MKKEGTFITDGRDLNGSAMPRILARFQKAVVGHIIKRAGYVVVDNDFDGLRVYPALELDNGTFILASQDDEMNGPGVLYAGDCVLCETGFKP